jgi:predicted Rossmann-fold nucleotide-binding protein
VARRNIGLVYGGGNVGLMGVLADAVLGAGGEAVGVIPESLFPVQNAGKRRCHVPPEHVLGHLSCPYIHNV